MTVERDTDTTTGRRARHWRVPALLLTAAVVGTSLTAGLVATQADAAAPNTSAQLTLTGISSQRYPTGGNIAWLQPGGTLSLSAATAGSPANTPVISLLGGVLNTVIPIQITANLQKIGGGASRTFTSNQTGSANGFTTGALSRGVYTITWSAKSISLLGAAPIQLSGNQAQRLGVALNASNQYVGYIYVNSSPPPSKFSIQIPTISVAPSLPVVGQLPTVTVPGTTVSVPGVQVPGQSSGSSSSPTTGSSSTPGSTGSTAPGSGTSTSTTTNPYGYTAPGCTGPCAVVPKGGGSGGTVGGAYDVTLGDLNDPAASGGSASSSSGSDASAGTNGSDVSLAQGGAQNGANAQIAVDRAFAGTGSDSDSAPGLPTTLTLVAIAALAGSSVLWFARRRLARG